MNRNIRLILITILIILSVLLTTYFIKTNIIKSKFLIEKVQIEKDEMKKREYLEDISYFLSMNLFKDMPNKYKKDFLNNPEQYDCYKLIINVRNSSEYKANAVIIKYKKNIKDLWVDEDCDTIVPYIVRANTDKALITHIICKKGTLENKKLDLDLAFYIDCPILQKVTISY